tara:strand:+ start:79 stop:285 length:207 start_codon:yes stop_codon:yes gene_type:complete
MSNNEKQFTLNRNQVDFIIQECKSSLEFGDFFTTYEVDCTLDVKTTEHLVAVTTLLNAMIEARETWNK